MVINETEERAKKGRKEGRTARTGICEERNQGKKEPRNQAEKGSNKRRKKE